MFHGFRTGASPLVMGIVNVTPDSFSDGGSLPTAAAACDYALRLEEDGADILDIGGESTRPGARPVGQDEEAERVLPVIERIRARSGIAVSIDTMKPAIARIAVAAGADIWNDVSALDGEPSSLAEAALLGVPVVLMHKRGAPCQMQDAPVYENVVAEIARYLKERRAAAIAAGIAGDAIWIDPGIGFGKTLAHNLALMGALPGLAALAAGRLVIGVSRKRFIQMIDPAGSDASVGRLGGSLAAALHAARAGAHILRVHDVRETCQALAVAAALTASGKAG